MNTSLGLSLLLYPVQFVCWTQDRCYLRSDSKTKGFFMVWSERKVSTLIQCALHINMDANLEQHQLLKVDGICTQETTNTLKSLVAASCKRKGACVAPTDPGCRRGRCQCPMGYSFDQKLDRCRNLRDCYIFGAMFNRYPNQKMMSSTITKSRRASKEKCKRMCLETSETCRAFLQYERFGTCVLLRHTKSRLRKQRCGMCVYYERPCDW